MITAAAAVVMTAVAVMAAAVALFRRGRSNSLIVLLFLRSLRVLLFLRATGAAAASEITATFQRLHQRHADLSAAAHIWLY